MNNKKIGIVIAIVIVLGVGFILYKRIFPDEYVITNDEIALHIQMNIKEDVGLLIFDYSANDREYSGGISNADRSLIKPDTEILDIWRRQELNSSSDKVELSIQFRIVMEYVEPNYENNYPEDITKYIDTPISWEAHFGEEYFITITGDKINGYRAVLNENVGMVKDN